MVKRSRSLKATVEEEPSVVDEELVAEAVGWIRDKFAHTLHKGMSEVGEYILEKFFDGKASQVRSKNPNKNASFRSLVEHCGTPDLPVGRSALHASVSVALMLRSLPEATSFKRLPPSHQATLVRFHDDPAKVEKLAKGALRNKLSVRDLKVVVLEEVAKTPVEGEKRGPRPKPVILKTLDHALKIFALEGGKRSFTKAQVEELDEEDAKRALKAAEALKASVEKLIEKLTG